MATHPQAIPQLVDISNKIAELTVSKGGATWNLVEGNLLGTPNYAVSVFPERCKVISLGRCPEEAERHDIAGEVEAFIRANKDVLMDDPRVSIGTWEHEGHLYLDLSITVPSLALALELGRQYGQNEIFDLARLGRIQTAVAAA